MKRIAILILLALWPSVAEGQAVSAVPFDARRVNIYYVDRFGASANDSTDDTTAITNALAACQATGGELRFSAGTYILSSAITVPNDAQGIPRQRAMRWVGAGADQRGHSGSAGDPYGGTVLRFDSASGVGCIDTRGDGMLEITGIVFWQDSTAHTIPYIHTTNTTLQVHHCGFLGHDSKEGATCNQDAIILGGTTTTIDGTDDAPFQGYGSVIQNNWFNRIRRGVYFRTYANSVVVRDNNWWNKCGGACAIEFDGGDSTCTGNIVSGNLIEMTAYTDGIKAVDSAVRNQFISNNFFDAPAGVDNYYEFDATSEYNIIIDGYQVDSETFVGGAGATSQTFIRAAQSQESQFPGPVNFTNAGDGVDFSGVVDFSGTTTLNGTVNLHGSATIDLLSSNTIRGDVNNTAMLKQKNAAGAAYINLAYIDADNRWRQGSAGVFVGTTPTSGTYPNSFFVAQPSNGVADGILYEQIAPNITGNYYAMLSQGSITQEYRLSVYNNSATATADAVLDLRTINGSGGDPYINFDVNGAGAWSIGLDNSVSDEFVIANSWHDLSTAKALRIEATTLNATFGGDVSAAGNMNTSAASTLTCASDAVTQTESNHLIAGQDGNADDLATISGGTAGDILIIRAADTDDTITVKDGTGNIKCGGDRALDNTEDTMMLLYDGTNWLEIAFANNGA